MSSAASTVPSSAPAAKGGRFGIGMLLGVALLAVAGAGGTAYFVLGKVRSADAQAALKQESAPHPGAPAAYLALEPAFVVNLESSGEQRYLQVDVQLMARDLMALDAAGQHLPLIRNSLLMLLGQQNPDDLSTRAGKEALQKTALAEVRKVLQAETGKPVVEALYFTSFVMQ